MATVRPRRDSDLDELVKVLKIVHEDSNKAYPIGGVANAAEFITGHDTLQAFVAEVDGKIVGHALVGAADRASPAVTLWQDEGREGKVAVFNRLFVDSRCRGQGVAKKLEQAVLDYGREHSLILLLYALEKLPHLRAMYEKWGWEYFGKGTFYYGEGQSAPAHCYAAPKDKR